MLLIKYPAAQGWEGSNRDANVQHAPRARSRWTEAIITALDEQAVVVAGTDAAGLVLPRLATSLVELRSSWVEVLEPIKELVQSHPLFELLTSMSAVDARTTLRVLTGGVIKDSASAARLASYASLVPVTWRPGTSIHGDQSSKRGNKVLKRAPLLQVFVALEDPSSRAYYIRKRAHAKKHDQALIVLARRWCNVLCAMLVTGSIFTLLLRQSQLGPPEPRPRPGPNAFALPPVASHLQEIRIIRYRNR